MTNLAPAVPAVPEVEVAAVLAELAAQVAALRVAVEAGRPAGAGFDVVAAMKAGYATAVRDLGHLGCGHVPGAGGGVGRSRLALVPPQGGAA